MVTLVRPVQPEKAFHPISVTLSGMVTLVSFAQPSKAPPPISVTPAGMVTLVRFAQPSKAFHPIFVMPSGMATSPPGPVYLVKTPFLMTKSCLFSMVKFLLKNI